MRSRLMRLISAAAFAFCALAPARAYAKSVQLEWKAIPNATGYEVAIKSSSARKPRTFETEHTAWEGDLKPGTYTYMIRGRDKFGRKGPWSASQMLAVMPEQKPEVETPSASSVIAAYDTEAKVPVRWKAVAAVERYRVTVTGAHGAVRESMISGNQMDDLKLPPGDYKVEVAPVLRKGGREFVGAAEHSAMSSFQVQRHALDAPTLRGPHGVVEAALPGKLAFAWEPVEGARYYELSVPGSQPIRIEANQLAVTVTHPVQGQWQVTPLTEGGRRGPASVSQITLLQEVPVNGDLRTLHVVYALEPYTYEVVSASHDSAGSVSSSAAMLGLGSEINLAPRWSFEGRIEESLFQIADVSRDRKTLGARAMFRWNPADSDLWVVLPHAGIEAREYFVLGADPTDGSGAATQEHASLRVDAHGFQLGGVAGLEVRRTISEHWTVSARGTAFRALASTGLPAGASSQSAPLLGNSRFELRSLHWLSPRWGLSGSAAVDRREVDYSAGSGNESASWASKLLQLGFWFRW